MSTLLCISIMIEEGGPAGEAGVGGGAGVLDAALRQAHAARAAGADLVEFRIDQVFSGATGDGAEYEQRQMLGLVADSPLPCIVTCRPVSEGGHFDGDESARLALFERLGTAFGPGEVPPRFIDVELATYTRSSEARRRIDLAIAHPEQLRDVPTSLILSLHDFAGRPADLSRKLLELREAPAANVVKIAYRARSLRDNLELFEILAHRDRPTIALGMGEFGLISRVLAPKFGGFLTFAGLHEQTATAPGQPALGDLLDLYRFRSISSGTKVYGIIGYPIAHSLSPHVHNAGFEAVGHDGIYLPLPVAGDGGDQAGGYESLKATLAELIDYAPLDFAGASITIPHKENLVRLARDMGWRLDRISSASGAANTLSIQRDPASGAVTDISIVNTDATSLLEVACETMGEMAGRKVALIGAGGVARAAAAALIDAGAKVHIYNRTRDRADALSQPFGELGPGTLTIHDWDDLATADCDLVINCTPLGMVGGPDPVGSPLGATVLAAMPHHTVVMETVYNPPLTPLLNAAHAAGLKSVDGVSMFVRQAAAQFKIWTGAEAPRGLFERIVRERAGT